MESKLSLDQLPHVLQKEIWEHVRGDRNFWKKHFERVLVDIDLPITADRYVRIDQTGLKLIYRAHILRTQTVTNGDNNSAKFFERREMGYEVIRSGETCRKLTGRAWFETKKEALAAFSRLAQKL